MSQPASISQYLSEQTPGFATAKEQQHQQQQQQQEQQSQRQEEQSQQQQQPVPTYPQEQGQTICRDVATIVEDFTKNSLPLPALNFSPISSASSGNNSGDNGDNQTKGKDCTPVKQKRQKHQKKQRQQQQQQQQQFDRLEGEIAGKEAMTQFTTGEQIMSRAMASINGEEEFAQRLLTLLSGQLCKQLQDILQEFRGDMRRERARSPPPKRNGQKEVTCSRRKRKAKGRLAAGEKIEEEDCCRRSCFRKELSDFLADALL